MTTAQATLGNLPARWKSLKDLTRTKTIATVGPSCSSRERLVELTLQGVDVFRLNMAHANRATHEQTLQDIRWASLQAGVPVGVLVDLAGPKIRLGRLFEDPLQCNPGQRLTFARGDVATRPDELVCSYPSLIDEVQLGNWIMLRDGLVRLNVVDKTPDRVTCLVVDGGTVRSRQGVNLPGVNLSVPAMSETDIANAIWATKNGADFISLSFVRHAAEVHQLKRLIADHQGHALTIAKIEKREALENLDAIVAASDAVMVARGDLGVEIEIEKTPLAQKRIIRTCQAIGKPVIVATQMLESMHDSLQPTRAEVSDVANAILDGADACMLSGETAIGQFPRQAVRMMRKVMLETEQMLRHRRSLEVYDEHRDHGVDVVSAVVYGAAQIARRLDARMVVIATTDGEAALIKSKQRDFVPTVALTDQPSLLHQMCLYWGVIPVLNHSFRDPEELQALVQRWAEEDATIQVGDKVVYVIDTDNDPASIDMVMVGNVADPRSTA